MSQKENTDREQNVSNEDLIQQLESTANFMRGMQFDPRIPSDTKQALVERAEEIDELVEKYLEVEE